MTRSNPVMGGDVVRFPIAGVGFNRCRPAPAMHRRPWGEGQITHRNNEPKGTTTVATNSQVILSEASDSASYATRGAGRRIAGRLFRNVAGLTGILIVLIMTAVAVGAPVLAPYDPLEIHKGEQFQPPSVTYLFGTDEFGRDIFSRTLYAGRISMLAGAFAVAVAASLGVPLGLVSGYAGGLVDTAFMRSMDSLLAFPAVLLALAIVAVLGPGSINAMIAVAIVSVPTFARLARAAMLTQKGMDYVEAARSIGSPSARIVFRTILPNSLAPILVQATLAVAFAILLEAALSFLGLGTQPPDASWGAMLNAGRGYLRRAWWYGFFPGLFITCLVFGLNNLSEALRDVLDPTYQDK